MSALVVDGNDDEDDDRTEGDLAMLVGTGGETLPGSLWRVPVSSVVDGNTDGAQQIIEAGEKGVIATPSLADLTGDCLFDVVVQSFDGTVTAVDGATSEPLWTVTNPGFETYSSPTLGYFVGDDSVPDVFVGIAAGVWPDYAASDYLIIDGLTGEVMWRETLGTFAPSGFVAADLNGDGRDEVIFGVNRVEENTQHLYVLDTVRGQLHTLLILDQTTFSAPWIGDLDGDGGIDLIATESAYQTSGSAIVRRFSLDFEPPAAVSWGGYLGTDGDGRLGH